MKLLDTQGGNTKVAKTNLDANIRYASLSLMPTAELCPNSTKAGCFHDCLKTAGRGRMSNVAKGRQRKTDWLLTDTQGFKTQLITELTNFERLCVRNGKLPVVRLNTISDYNFRSVKELFPNIVFLDYTKIANRIARKLPNERYIFSFSNEPEYAQEVDKVLALPQLPPIAVVFRGEFPKLFLDLPVIDGDKSDWVNAHSEGFIVGLAAKGDAKKSTSNFVVDTSLITTVNLR